MPEVFQFKKFSIHHTESAMKVGTDAILLGAWAQLPHEDATLVCDVGSGTGIVGLMMAQREPQIQVVGYEVDRASAREGQKNMANSPWSNRCSIVHGLWQDTWTGERADLIVSNPPYFEAYGRSGESSRKTARQEVQLTLKELLVLAYERTVEQGSLAVVVPAARRDELFAMAKTTQWHLWRMAEISGKTGDPPKRLLLHWSKQPRKTSVESFSIYSENGLRSDVFKGLTMEFYLR